MVITYDDQFLLTASEDGCLLISKIVDENGRGLRSNRQIVHTEEILVTKADLEERVCWTFNTSCNRELASSIILTGHGRFWPNICGVYFNWLISWPRLAFKSSTCAKSRIHVQVLPNIQNPKSLISLDGKQNILSLRRAEDNKHFD